MKKYYLLIVLVFSIAPIINSQITQIGTKIDGSENVLQAGASISFNNEGTILAVGYLKTNPFFEDLGMVRVFELQNNDWVQKGSDIGNQNLDDKGFHVSLNGNGNILAMSTGSVSGAGSIVTIYQFINEDWYLLGNPININNGYAQLNELGDTIVISDSNNEVTVYELISNDWQIKGSIINSEGLFWGINVDINNTGNIIAVSDFMGGSNEGNVFSNRIYLFENNQWIQIGNIETITNSLTSQSINLSNFGDACLISSFRNDSNDELYLESKIYKFENEIWSQTGNSIITSPIDEFFYIENISTISADGNIVAIGNPKDDGNVMLYRLNNNQWSQLGEGIFGNGGEFGRALSFNEDASRLSIGAPKFSDIGLLHGQVTSYEIDYSIFSTEDNLYTPNITLFPNPTNDYFQITSQNILNITKLSVYDISGKLVLEKYNNKKQIDLSTFASGLLLVKIETNKGVITKKIIKE